MSLRAYLHFANRAWRNSPAGFSVCLHNCGDCAAVWSCGSFECYFLVVFTLRLKMWQSGGSHTHLCVRLCVYFISDSAAHIWSTTRWDSVCLCVCRAQPTARVPQRASHVASPMVALLLPLLLMTQSDPAADDWRPTRCCDNFDRIIVGLVVLFCSPLSL